MTLEAGSAAACSSLVSPEPELTLTGTEHPGGAAPNAPPLALTSEVISTDRASVRTYEAVLGIVSRLEDELGKAWAGNFATGALLKAEKLERQVVAWKRRALSLLRCTMGDQGAMEFVCPCCAKRKLAQPMGCNQRFCPRCVKKLREQNVAHVLELMENVDARRARDNRRAARWRFVTLTVKSQPRLGEMRRFLAECWGKLVRRVWWRRNVAACLAAFEVTHTAAGWHVHVHALVDAYVPREWLVKVWEKITGGEGLAVGVHVSEPKGSRAAIARELSKYIGKDLGGHFAENPGQFGVAGTSERLQEFIWATHRFRTLRAYGDAFYASEIERNGAGMLCEECMAPMEFDRVVWMDPEELAAARRAQRSRARDPAKALV